MKIKLWLTRDNDVSDYELWEKEPTWDKEDGTWDVKFGLFQTIYPSHVRRLFHINWKGGKRSIRKLTVEI